MADRIIYGSVDLKGTKISGSSGFSVARTGLGIYTITFNPDYLAPPVVVVTFTATVQSSSAINNVATVFPTAGGCTIWTFNVPHSGPPAPQDGPFNFVAIGIV